MKKLLLGIAFALGFAPTAFAQYAGPGPGPIPGLVIGTTTGTAYDGGLGAAAAATASAALPKAGGTMTGTINNGTLSGTVASAAVRVATGTTASRAIADAAADSINVMDFTGIDPTGTTDSHTEIQAAITLACTFSPPKAVVFPRNGIFDIASVLSVPSGCVGLTLTGTNSKLTADASNTSNPMIFHDVGVDGLTINGITFDSSNNSTNTHGLASATSPIRGFTLTNDTFQNVALGNAWWFYSADQGTQVASLKGTLASAVNGGTDSTMTFTNFTTLGDLHVGAYVNSPQVDPDLYVTAFNSGTYVVTFNKVIPDSVAAAQAISFTPAATLQAAAYPNSAFLQLDTTTAITVGQTAIQPEGICIPPNDRIVSLSSSPVGVTLEAPPICPIASGTSLAFASGFSNVTFTNDAFKNLGQGQRYANSASYTSAADMPGSTNTQVFTCVLTGCTSEIGLAVGDETASAQGGLPANDIIVARALNTPTTSEYTVTYATPSSATDTPVASYNFNTSALAGNGYALWSAYGAWFSNRAWNFSYNTYTNIWSSPLLLAAVSDYTAVGDKCYLNFLQTQSPTVAGSSCKYIEGDRNMQEVNLTETGATGVGVLFQHDIDSQVVGGNYSFNAADGLDFTGGRSNHISGGGVSKDNNQAANMGLAQVNLVGAAGNGVTLSGGYTYTLAGTQYGTTVGDWYSYDDQATPTQYYGIGKGNNPSNTNQPVSVIFTGKLAGIGNTQGLIQQSLLSTPTSSDGTVQSGSTNENGSVTEGTSVTGTTITFSTLNKNPAFQNGHCVVQGSTSSITFTSTTDPVTTSLMWAHASSSGAKIVWHCSDNLQ